MIINSYDTLSVGKYSELMEIVNSDADTIDKNLGIVSVLTGIDTIELYNMPATHFNHLLQNAAFLSEKPKPAEMKNTYKVGKYTLEANYDIASMTTAAFVDYQTYGKEPDIYTAELLACFLIPKGCIYNSGYDLGDVVKTIREELSIRDALTLSAFFLKVYEGLWKSIRIYLTKRLHRLKMRKLQTTEVEKALEALEKSGVGSRS